MKIRLFATFSTQRDQRFLFRDPDFRSVAGHLTFHNIEGFCKIAEIILQYLALVGGCLKRLRQPRRRRFILCLPINCFREPFFTEQSLLLFGCGYAAPSPLWLNNNRQKSAFRPQIAPKASIPPKSRPFPPANFFYYCPGKDLQHPKLHNIMANS